MATAWEVGQAWEGGGPHGQMVGRRGIMWHWDGWQGGGGSMGVSKEWGDGGQHEMLQGGGKFKSICGGSGIKDGGVWGWRKMEGMGMEDA